MTRNLVSSAVLAALVLAQAAPAFAQQSTRKPSKAGTILKWTLIGAGIGAGTGFWMGFRAYDDATFAERKIAHATMVSAAIGAGAGFLIGRARSNATAAATTTSLWKPSRPRRPESIQRFTPSVDLVSRSKRVLAAGGNRSIAYRSVVRGIDGPFDFRYSSSFAESLFPASRKVQPTAF
jgi:hypothetical protein